MVSNPQINKRAFRMKEAFKTQLSKVLGGGVNISWLKLGLRGMAGNWITQDILMPVF